MLRTNLGVGLRGVAMGMAEVVPGVSGGTIAFVTGIYERLLTAITAFSPQLLVTFRERGWSAVWRDIQGSFLLFLLGGMATGIVIGVFSVTYLLEALSTGGVGLLFWTHHRLGLVYRPHGEALVVC